MPTGPDEIPPTLAGSDIFDNRARGLERPGHPDLDRHPSIAGSCQRCPHGYHWQST